MNEKSIVIKIKQYYVEHNVVPTVAEFSQSHNLYASSIVRQFGSWNYLLKQAGFKPNKETKRTDAQLILWLKAHPETRYDAIPPGIRGALEDRFGSIGKARREAGLTIVDWRATKKKKNNKAKNNGRPIEYTKEQIIVGLQNLASNLGRPPRARDVSKKSCGFPISAIVARFGSLNQALQAASLPPIYSHHEFRKLVNELTILMLNIKLSINDIPSTFGLEIDGDKPLFTYPDRWEDLRLTRNDIANSADLMLRYKNKCSNIIIWYLVDDSLYESSDFKLICVTDLIDKITNQELAARLKHLRLRYDEISRKYIGQPLWFDQEEQW